MLLACCCSRVCRTGRLVTSKDVCSGRYAGGILGKSLVLNELDVLGRPMRYHFPRKSIIVIEANMLELDDTQYEVRS